MMNGCFTLAIACHLYRDVLSHSHDIDPLMHEDFSDANLL